MGVVGPGVEFAKKKFFNEESGHWTWPWSVQGNFTPYNPDEHLSMQEIIVQDSVKALQCAINSQAVGKFDYTNTNVCPAGYTKNGNSISYGFSKVNCSGISSRLLSFGSLSADGSAQLLTKEQSIQLLGESLAECYKNSKDVNLEYEYTKCAYFDNHGINSGLFTTISKKEIQDYLKKKNTEDYKQASARLDNVKFSGLEGCIYYDKDRFNKDDLQIDDCSVDNPTDYFNCYVSNFTLPQNLTTAEKWIPAFGDPEYLVYYEKFPEVAAKYWQKSWMDLVSYSTLAYIGGSGLLNMVGVGGGGKVVKEVGKEGIEKSGKEVIEKAAKEAAEQAAEQGSLYIIKRASKSNLKNILKSLIAEDQFARITLMSDDIAQEVGEAYITRIGTKSGKEAFEKVEKELTEDITNIIRSKITKTPAGFQWADKSLQEYQDEVIKVIMQGGKTTDGLTITGLRELTEKQLTKEMTKELLEKQSYKTFFKTLFKKGTTELDQALLEEATEKSFKRLAALNNINSAYVEKSLTVGAEKIGKILLQGTTGITQKEITGITESTILEKKFWENIVKVLGKQAPINWESKTMVGKLALGVPVWVKNHPLPTAVILAVLIDGVDSTNEKYVPVGINSIAVTQPSLLSPKKTFNFNSLTEKYFIRNQLKEGNPLYFVSPCVANLKVVKRKCTCANNPSLAVFNFGGGLINAEQGTIELKSEEERIQKYTQEWNSLASSQKVGYSETLEKHINFSLMRDNDALLMIQKGSFGGTLDLGWIGGGELNQMVKYDFNIDAFDFSNAVKVCSDRTIVGGIFHGAKTFGYGFLDAFYQDTGLEPTDAEWENLFNQNIDYKSDCIEIEPERTYGYCYDYFPRTEWIRTGVMVGSLIVDVAIIAISGGTAAPIVFFSTGVISSAIDLVLESSEKWPQGGPLALLKDAFWIKYFV